MTEHKVVSRDEWLAARRQLLAKEKEFTRARDRLSAERRALPWERVEKKYVFHGAAGDETLAQLFGDRSQLLVYHFMFGPDWDEGCKSCSFWADSFNLIPSHLAHRDATFVAISHAPYQKLQAYAKRLGWSFKWVSSAGSDFNHDYRVSFAQRELDEKTPSYNFGTDSPKQTEMPGASAFYKGGDGAIYHTYSTYGRGIDILNAAYNWLDIAPKGRDEDKLPFTMSWVKRRDEYAAR
jgi:predicted dithiol-disulfide oxidoreductase (DUF899 family)